jgi:hypothetical protein
MADGTSGVLYPEWTGIDPAAGDWNTCILGDSIVPGIVSVEDLEVGIDIDTKKTRGHECPTSTDNGLRPTRFKLRVWLNTSMWQDWQTAVQSFQPRRPGRERQPLQIIHPLVNHLGITQVRVAGIKANSPTAKNGLVFQIMLEEWFDKPKEVKRSNTPIAANVDRNAAELASTHPEVLANEARLSALRVGQREALRDMSANDIDPTTGQPLKPSENIQSNVFSNPNVDGAP